MGRQWWHFAWGVWASETILCLGKARPGGSAAVAPQWSLCCAFLSGLLASIVTSLVPMDLLPLVASADVFWWRRILLPQQDFCSLCLTAAGKEISRQQVKEPYLRNVTRGWCVLHGDLNGSREAQQPIVELSGGQSTHWAAFVPALPHALSWTHLTKPLKAICDGTWPLCWALLPSFCMREQPLVRSWSHHSEAVSLFFGDQECICAQCLSSRMSNSFAGLL